jgi:hypothetical protein
MSLKILCSVHLVRYPLGGFCWHHLQYLLGFERLGHQVAFFEDFGWAGSCYDPAGEVMTSDPSYGVRFVEGLLARHGFRGQWCYLAEDGRAHGTLSREALGDWCRDCDVYFNLSNMNWVEELGACRRRVLVDTDPVFVQIGAHGAGGRLEDHHRLFTYGENVHRPGCSMPTAGLRWLPTRQPVVLELWDGSGGDAPGGHRPFTTVTNWSAYGEHQYQGRVFGQKDREFRRFMDLPARSGEALELAISAPPEVEGLLTTHGWRLADPLKVSVGPEDYRAYLRGSAGEWCVAKHGYVATESGWFSDRSAAYLASGRPVVLQDTGYSRVLPCGEGLMAFREPGEAADAIRRVRRDLPKHRRAARRLAEEYFGSHSILGDLLERSL